MALHHTDDQECKLCENKLTTAHPYMADWFRRKKKQYKNLHVSWAWRDAEMQDRFYSEGRSRAKFPNSPHNFMKDDKPYSLALDLFQIDEDGVARFSPRFYTMLAEENAADREPIIWSGHFKSIAEKNHFELKKEALNQTAPRTA